MNVEQLYKQNQIIISLLGRIAFPEDKLRKIITKKSKKPKHMIDAYNLCNGNLTTNQIAKKVGIDNSVLNKATVKWEKMGIITNLGERGKGKTILPLHLYSISEEEE